MADSTSNEGRDARLSALDLTIAARETVQDLTGYPPEAVSGLQWDGDSWLVTVDVLELERIPSTAGLPGRPTESTNLADILERVLDKGIVIAGDIQINLLDIELLTIKLRLLIASVDRAREMGINWWESDPSLQAMERGEGDGRDRLERENRELR